MTIILIVVAANIGSSCPWCFEIRWSFVGFSLQSLWSLDLKTWFGKKSVCCNADGNGTPRNGDSGGTGHWIWQVFKSATCTTEVDANFVLSNKLRNNRRFKIHCCSAQWTKVTTCEPPAEYFECHKYPIFFLNIFLFVLTNYYYVETFSLRSTNSQRSNWMYEYFNYI